MSLGRPIGSNVRQKIIEILYFMKKGCGYDIHKIYLDLFPKVTQRLIYYHLKKGLDTGEFIVKNVKREKGDYSWGQIAEKTYYTLGTNAQPKVLKKIENYFLKKVKKIKRKEKDKTNLKN